MLIVTLTIRPEGDATRDREIGRMEISNVGHVGRPDICDYSVKVDGDAQRCFSAAAVRAHFRDLGAWELVQRALARVL